LSLLKLNQQEVFSKEKIKVKEKGQGQILEILSHNRIV
jgi:hypothetical protein